MAPAPHSPEALAALVAKLEEQRRATERQIQDTSRLIEVSNALYNSLLPKGLMSHALGNFAIGMRAEAATSHRYELIMAGIPVSLSDYEAFIKRGDIREGDNELGALARWTSFYTSKDYMGRWAEDETPYKTALAIVREYDGIVAANRDAEILGKPKQEIAPALESAVADAREVVRVADARLAELTAEAEAAVKEHTMALKDRSKPAGPDNEPVTVTQVLNHYDAKVKLAQRVFDYAQNEIKIPHEAIEASRQSATGVRGAAARIGVASVEPKLSVTHLVKQIEPVIAKAVAESNGALTEKDGAFVKDKLNESLLRVAETGKVHDGRPEELAKLGEGRAGASSTALARINQDPGGAMVRGSGE